MKRLALVAAGGTMVITLSACYGGPPVQENRARKPPETPTTAPAPSASTPNQ